MATADFSIFISGTCLPDQAVYEHWLNGHSVEQAIVALAPSMVRPSTTIRSRYVLAQYRNFELLEHYLHHPTLMIEQSLFPLSERISSMLIEMYYEFDEAVVRELLSRRLNSRSRKDLDDVCEKTAVSLGSCRRQFDNLKRVAKMVEDVTGNVSDYIESSLMLPSKLASQYAHIVFIQKHRIDVSRKKLVQYTFSDLEYCTAVFLKCWGINGNQFDPMFVHDAREIKHIIIHSKDVFEELKAVVIESLQQSKSAGRPFSINLLGSLADNIGMITGPSTSSKDFLHLFRALVRNILAISSGLGHAKDVRDLFNDLVEKVIDLTGAAGWKRSDFEVFMEALSQSWPNLTSVSPAVQRKMTTTWRRLIIGIKLSALRLYNEFSNALTLVA